MYRTESEGHLVKLDLSADKNFPSASALGTKGIPEAERGAGTGRGGASFSVSRLSVRPANLSVISCMVAVFIDNSRKPKPVLSCDGRAKA